MEFKCTEETLETMYRYLLKYVGTYRVKAEYDLSTNDFPKNQNGQLDESFEDLYIPCSKGVIKHTYLGTDVLVCCFYGKSQQGKNVFNALVQKYPKIDFEYDDEGIDSFIYFDASNIKKVATIVKPKTAGAKIDPFSSKNLPKLNYKIPSKDLMELYDITKDLSRTDTMHFFKDANSAYLTKFNKKEKAELKESRLSLRDFIHYKGMWENYLKYIKRKYTKYSNTNA